MHVLDQHSMKACAQMMHDITCLSAGVRVLLQMSDIRVNVLPTTQPVQFARLC